MFPTVSNEMNFVKKGFRRSFERVEHNHTQLYFNRSFGWIENGAGAVREVSGRSLPWVERPSLLQVWNLLGSEVVDP